MIDHGAISKEGREHRLFSGEFSRDERSLSFETLSRHCHDCYSTAVARLEVCGPCETRVTDPPTRCRVVLPLFCIFRSLFLLADRGAHKETEQITNRAREMVSISHVRSSSFPIVQKGRKDGEGRKEGSCLVGAALRVKSRGRNEDGRGALRPLFPSLRLIFELSSDIIPTNCAMCFFFFL